MRCPSLVVKLLWALIVPLFLTSCSPAGSAVVSLPSPIAPTPVPLHGKSAHCVAPVSIVQVWLPAEVGEKRTVKVAESPAPRL